MAKSKIFVKNSIIVLTISVLYCLNIANGYKIGVGRADCTGPPVEVVFVSNIVYKHRLL